MSRRIVVTGSSGFIGRNCLTPLREAGFEVVAVGRRHPRTEGVEFRQCDLLNADDRRRAFTGVNASHLLHLAWYLEPGSYAESALNLDWLAASLGLVRQFAEEGGQRAVVAGTCFEYDWSRPRLAEGSPLAPRTMYGGAKRLLHEALSLYASRGGPEVAWARLFFLFGPGEDRRRLAAAVATSVLSGHEVATSAGTQRRDYMYVEDAGRALAALAASSVTEAVNVATGDAIAVRDLIGMIGREAGNLDLVRFGARPTPPDEPDLVEADVTRLNSEVGFSAYTALEEAVKATVEWWRRELRL